MTSVITNFVGSDVVPLGLNGVYSKMSHFAVPEDDVKLQSVAPNDDLNLDYFHEIAIGRLAVCEKQLMHRLLCWATTWKRPYQHQEEEQHRQLTLQDLQAT